MHHVEGANDEEVSLFHAKTNGEIELVSWYWSKYNETVKIALEVMKRVKGRTSISVDDSNRTKISQVSDKDLGELFRIYEDVIKQISEIELTKNPDYK
ncbi:MAG: hypothetical protein ABIE03_06000 [Patescibacteria group bacterium]|nr:hypothetical protein [Patescibacteria group bacterium]